jgi:hypothetical protein
MISHIANTGVPLANTVPFEYSNECKSKSNKPKRRQSPVEEKGSDNGKGYVKRQKQLTKTTDKRQEIITMQTQHNARKEVYNLSNCGGMRRSEKDEQSTITNEPRAKARAREARARARAKA